MSSKGKLFVVSGPSGVGKGTIVAKISPEMAALSISATTRPIGKGEIDGVNYWFISREKFEAGIEKGLYLEYAEVFGNLYGTPMDRTQETIDQGKNIILEIDVQGGLQVKKKWPDAIMIFILPPSIEELERRIRSRGRDAEDVIARRLQKASDEIKIGNEHYDYFVVNDILENAVSEVESIIDKS